MSMLPNSFKAGGLAAFFLTLSACQSPPPSDTEQQIEPLQILLLNANQSIKSHSACEGFASEQIAPSLADDLAASISAMNNAPIALEQACEPTDGTELFCQIALKSEAGDLEFSRHYQFMVEPETQKLQDLKCFNLP